MVEKVFIKIDCSRFVNKKNCIKILENNSQILRNVKDGLSHP